MDAEDALGLAEEDASSSFSDGDGNGDADDADDADHADDAEEEVGLALRLPKRTTRGQRVRVLEGEEADAHEQYWGQQAWAENEEDNEEEVQSDEFSSSDVEDSADSDIDIDENDDAPDLMAQDEGDEGGKKKKRVFLRPPAKPRAPKRPRTKMPLPPRSMEVRTSTANVGREMDAKQRAEAEEQSLRKRRKQAAPKAEGARLMTQRQLLAEAVRIEVENRRSLEMMMLLMAEKKRLRERQEQQRKGARIITRSFVRQGESRIEVTYSDPALFPAAAHSKAACC